MPFHAFFGVAIMMATGAGGRLLRRAAGRLERGPAPGPGRGGGIVWAFGELPTVLVLLVVFFSWAGSEERRGRAIDRAADRNDDAEREAYNARLRQMAQRGADSPRRGPSGRSAGRSSLLALISTPETRAPRRSSPAAQVNAVV